MLEAASNKGHRKSKAKYISFGKHHHLEQALFFWFLQMRSKRKNVTNNLLLAKAKTFANEFDVDDSFKFSETWVRNFKKRHGIKRLKISGEKLSCDASSVEPFKNDFLAYVQQRKLATDQIYNADESALFYKALFGYTLAHDGEDSAPGFKTAKDRITFMPCANASGTHKLPIFVIGRSKAPRAFKNVEIPVEYASSKNAWMTREIFQKWFHESFVPNVRRFSKEAEIEPKAVLLLDNCTAHHFKHELRSTDGLIEVKFLPPNVTPLLQPMDQQVIQIIKTKYREMLYMDIICDPDNSEQRLKKINLKDVSYWLHESWMNVSQKAIQRSWKNIGWTVGSSLLHEDDVPLQILFNSPKDTEAVKTVKYDEEELCVDDYSDADIIALVRNDGTNDCDEDDDIDVREERTDEDSFLEGLIPAEPPQLTRTQQVAYDLNRIIDWAEDKHLDMADILHLRKIHIKAQQMSLNDE